MTRTDIWLFLLVLTVHTLSPATQVTDSRLSVPTAVNLARHGTFWLEDVPAVQALENTYDQVTVGGHVVMGYPYPPALLLVPAVSLLGQLPGVDLAAASKLDGSSSWVEGAVGTLFSPSRGILLYMPFVLLSVCGLWLMIVSRSTTPFLMLLCGVIALHWALIASWGNWWGGSSYGPRLFADVAGFLVLFTIPTFDWLQRRRVEGVGSKRSVVVAGTAVWALLVASVAVQANGSLLRASFCWNATPAFIDDAPERNWDWSDPQMARGIRRLAAGDDPASVIAGSC